MLHASSALSSDLDYDNLPSLERQQQIFDPLGLYPKNSIERRTGVIQPMEQGSTASVAFASPSIIYDPLSLYQDRDQSTVTTDVVMSASLPFLPRPAGLGDINGRDVLPGDRGFDPFNFATDQTTLLWYREAELKHARLAMLASVGWVVSELTHTTIAAQFHLESVLVGNSEKVPSVLNGGLGQINPFFWMEVLCVAAVLEFITIRDTEDQQRVVPGDFEFDPVGLGGFGQHKFDMQEAEIFNGRLAMLAITGFAVQECLLNDAVIQQTPFFFGR